MSVYLNNSGAGTYGGQVWGVGSDANDGLSRALPKLTANAALDLYLDAGQDGESLIIAPGSYTYTNGDGRYILSHEVVNVQPDVDWSVLLTFDGINSQGLRFNGSTSETRDITVGKINITTANAAKTTQVIFSHNNAASLLMAVDWNAILIPQGGLSGEIGLDLSASNLIFNGNDGGTSGEDGLYQDFGTAGDYRPITYGSTIAHVHSAIQINKWVCNARIPLVGGIGIVSLATDNAITSGVWNVKGVTGLFIDSAVIAGLTYAVVIENGPDDATIEENDNLEFRSDHVNRGTSMWNIRAPDAITTNRSRIRNNKRSTHHSESGVGFQALIGSEGVDNLTPDGWIYGNTIVSTTGVTNSLHGSCHIGCTGGLRFLNELSGASIGSLTKRGTALSFRNVYRNISGTSNTFLYGKGAEDGTEFFGETCYLPNEYSGNIMQALEDVTGVPNQDSVNTVFKDIVVLMDNGAPDATMRIALTGGAADTSNSIMTGVMVDNGVDLSGVTNLAAIAGVEFTNFNDWNADASVDAVLQNDGVEDFIAVLGGVSGLAYSPRFGFINTDLLISLN